jgi:hypothetical protein
MYLPERLSVKVMRKTIFILLILCVLQSCKSHKDDVVIAERYIDVPEAAEVAFTDLVSEYGSLCLEATDASLLSVISKIRIYKNKIFLMDGYGDRRLVVFSKEGKYITTVGHRGRGPNEYVKLANFEIDYWNDELMLCDYQGEKLLVYDLDGNFKYGKHINKPLTSVARLENGNLVLGFRLDNIWANDQCTLAVCNPDGEIIESYIKNVTEPFRFGIAAPDMMMSHPSGFVSFMPQFNDVIYHIDDNNVVPYWGIRFAHGTVNISNMGVVNAPEEFDKTVRDKNFLVGEHAENEDYIYVLNKDLLEREHIIYEKKSGKVKRIKNHLIGQHIVIDDEGYFWSYESEPMLHFMDNDIATEIKDLREKSDNLTLMYYKLKAF